MSLSKNVTHRASALFFGQLDYKYKFHTLADKINGT
jgi:hypothetical protein